jgi:hypothetical protein
MHFNEKEGFASPFLILKGGNKMSEVTIEQMNEAIAQFEGWELTSRDGIDCLVKDGYRRYHYELKYHSSWDWLMPVVEKIESIYDDFHGYFGVHISSNSCYIQGTKLRTEPGKEHYAYFNEATLSTKILSTHCAVYLLILWYNKQKEVTNG